VPSKHSNAAHRLVPRPWWALNDDRFHEARNSASAVKRKRQGVLRIDIALEIFN